MLCPVLCTCGRALSCKYLLYKYIKELMLEAHLKNRKIIPEMISTTDELEVNMGEVLDELGFTRSCCRQIMISNKAFLDYY